MSESPLMQSVSEAVANGVNVIAAIRKAMGYSMEDLAVTCGLAKDELETLEAESAVPADTLRRIANAVGLPATVFAD